MIFYAKAERSNRQKIWKINCFAENDRKRRWIYVWLCQCDCGNTHIATTKELKEGKCKSCGCYREEVIWKNIVNQRHLIDGTCLEILGEKKCRSDNKSGFRGVFQTKNGKYRVEIGFKRKNYYIATTKTLEEAI